MESIFIDTANISKNEKPLSAFVFNDQLKLKIDLIIPLMKDLL